MTLCGEGVVPAVTLSHPGGLLDFGYVLQNESTSQVLKVSQQCTNGKSPTKISTRTRLYVSSFEEKNQMQNCGCVDCWYELITAYVIILSPVLPAVAEQFSRVSGF